MNVKDASQIRREPLFQELVDRRDSICVGAVGGDAGDLFRVHPIIAFAPKLLGTPIGGGVMTVGIPVGLFVIVSAFVLTGIYVHRANSEFDRLTRQDHGKGEVMRTRSIHARRGRSVGHRRAWPLPKPGRWRDRRRRPAGAQHSRHRHVPYLRVRMTLGITKWAASRDPIGGGLLCRRRRHHRLPERAGDRRRLHVGGVVPRHFRPRLRDRLRRLDLFRRLAGRLADRAVPDRRAAAQSRQVHLRRRRLVPARADADPHPGGDRHADAWWRST